MVGRPHPIRTDFDFFGKKEWFGLLWAVAGGFAFPACSGAGFAQKFPTKRAHEQPKTERLNAPISKM
ncbi:MAG: hypothetical protein D6714_01945, partial [Bacteroidetes bacterium]